MNWCSVCCVICQRCLAIAQHGICSYCNQQIKRFYYCGCCGSQLAQDELHCGHCLRNEPSWEQMVIVGRYTEPLSQLIHRFKFQQQFYLDKALARLLYLSIRQAKRTHRLVLPELILPVPLHHHRQWYRGYNQSALLAKWLSYWLNIPYSNDVLVRHQYTPTQRGLSATQRRQNLRGAFSISMKGMNRIYPSVALVDDVITTGSTLNEIAKLLRKQGIQHIQVWGLART